MLILDYLGLVSLREHNRAMELVRRQRDDETIRANGLSAELAALRPDAEKHRARVEKGMKNLKQFRAKGENRPTA
jgi:hypothetical protein